VRVYQISIQIKKAVNLFQFKWNFGSYHIIIPPPPGILQFGPQTDERNPAIRNAFWSEFLRDFPALLRQSRVQNFRQENNSSEHQHLPENSENRSEMLKLDKIPSRQNRKESVVNH
jgi:hypothetical protein